MALLALGQTHGTLVGLHKASFLVWAGAFGVHVLVHLIELPRLRRVRIPGAVLRMALVTATVAAGLVLAIETLPAADRLQDHAAAHVGFDDREPAAVPRPCLVTEALRNGDLSVAEHGHDGPTWPVGAFRGGQMPLAVTACAAAVALPGATGHASTATRSPRPGAARRVGAWRRRRRRCTG